MQHCSCIDDKQYDLQQVVYRETHGVGSLNGEEYGTVLPECDPDDCEVAVVVELESATNGMVALYLS